jgi:hypothetical protein
MPQGEFEPLYRLPLDVRSGELPVLPLSIYGAVAHSKKGGDSSQFASADSFFLYLFDKQSGECREG